MMTHCIYILYSPQHHRIYVGETADLISRYHSHNSLAIKGHTIRYRPWIVVHVEFFNSRSEALSREKALKSGQGREWIHKNVIPDYR